MEANSLFGQPWTDVGCFSSYDEADRKRKQLSKEDNLQVKIKKQVKGFVVKTRQTLIEGPELETKERNQSDRRNKRKERRNDR